MNRERFPTKENWLTNARNTNTTSFWVAEAMRNEGIPIRVDTSAENAVPIYAGNDLARETFWEIIDTPEVVSIWHVLEGLDPRRSREFASARFDEYTKSRLVAEHFRVRANVFRAEKRYDELMIKAKKELPKGADFPTQTQLKRLVGKIVDKKVFSSKRRVLTS